jgi:hypothetical protein
MAGYVDGRWPSYADMVARFPGRMVIAIAADWQSDAQVIDCEAGDATDQEAFLFCQRQWARGQIPTIYVDESGWAAARAPFGASAQPNWWIAKQDGIAEMIPGAIAKQYRDAGPWDISIAADYWPGVDILVPTTLGDEDGSDDMELIRSDPNATAAGGGVGNGAVVAHLGGGVLAAVPATTFSTWVNLGRPVTNLAQGPWTDYTGFLARGEQANVAAIAAAVELAIANAAPSNTAQANTAQPNTASANTAS